MHFVIVKHGALGDVVRTAYFARALKERYSGTARVSWITSGSAVPLLRFNPYIDDIWTSFDEGHDYNFDTIFSLDDELNVVREVSSLQADVVKGACYGKSGAVEYSDDTAVWFDMGLLSRYGKEEADRRKKHNNLGHAQIFADIFQTNLPSPEFFGNDVLEQQVEREWQDSAIYVGVNAYAGGRWRAKELRPDELPRLVERLLEGSTRIGTNLKIVLLGSGENWTRNQHIARRFGASVMVPNTDDSLLYLAAIVKRLDYLITSDSLAMHLAIAQKRPCLAFFCPTSAAEIDSFSVCRKLVSVGTDYCSYRSDADNASITADRIEEAVLDHWRSGVISALGNGEAWDCRNTE